MSTVDYTSLFSHTQVTIGSHPPTITYRGQTYCMQRKQDREFKDILSKSQRNWFIVSNHTMRRIAFVLFTDWGHDTRTRHSFVARRFQIHLIQRLVRRFLARRRCLAFAMALNPMLCAGSEAQRWLNVDLIDAICKTHLT